VNRLSRKLRELEKNVVSETPDFEDTRLIIGNDAEQQLHERAKRIMENYRYRLDDAKEVLESGSDVNVDDSVKLSPEEDAIVFKSSSLITQRIMHLFDLAVGSFIHLNDPLCKWIFYGRLNWFLGEMQEWLFLVYREHQITSAPDFFTVCAGEQERRLKPVYDEWRDWLSKESWEKYYDEHKPKFRKYEDFTPEEKAQYDRDVEIEAREEAEWIEQDKRFLREKCPSCKEKCTWYYEQTGKRKKSERV
jgi:hypothetical protein